MTRDDTIHRMAAAEIDHAIELRLIADRHWIEARGATAAEADAFIAQREDQLAEWRVSAVAQIVGNVKRQMDHPDAPSSAVH